MTTTATGLLNAGTKARADAESARFTANALGKARADAESARASLAAAGAAVKDLEAQLRVSKRETQAARAERDRLVSEAEARADRAEAREVRAVARANQERDVLQNKLERIAGILGGRPEP